MTHTLNKQRSNEAQLPTRRRAATRALACLATLSGLFQAAQAAETLAFDAYGGVGFSGSTFGRQIPGLHLAARLSDVSLSLFSTGSTSELAETSYQQALAAYAVGDHINRYLQVHSSFGLSYQRSYRHLMGAGTNTDQTLEQTDHAWGPGFAIDMCLFHILCTRIEGHLGWSEAALHQIFHENGVASVGIRL